MDPSTSQVKLEPVSDSLIFGPGSTPVEFSVKSSQKRDYAGDEDETNVLRSKTPKIEASYCENQLSDGRIAGVDEAPVPRRCKQFWKVGDYEEEFSSECVTNFVGSDHVRVHPKFLHSNATSHKWALGALAELLDNSLDEVSNGATYVHVDSTLNHKDKTSMLIIEDNGGGMNPARIRHCMSFGYSWKRKKANTIGQYGNGMKTSTMRLGADAIVFSRCRGKDGEKSTQSIAMLSSTYLRETRQEDTVVPLIDFEKVEQNWQKMIHTTVDAWDDRLKTIVQWSPYLSDADLLKQFDFLNEQGTRIVIYNLWEDDQEQLELDFETDPYDIQLRGVNRDEKSIEMAKKYPNSTHFLTYRHSLRSYASILYLRLPENFKIILRGQVVQHHDITDDLMFVEELTYKPLLNPNETPKQNMVASVKLGFVKDAHHHIDIQGFNVYHKNRLIKPFWRVWNAAGSDGRGVIGVLEANFVEPAHDKQGFERTTVLSRLENRLIIYQKSFWSTKCHQIGYAPRVNSRKPETADKEFIPMAAPKSISQQDHTSKASTSCSIDNKNRSIVDETNEEGINRKIQSTVADQRSETHGSNKAFRCPLSEHLPSWHQQVASKEDEIDIKPRDLVVKRSEETGLVNLVAQLQQEKQLLESQLNEANAKSEEVQREHIALIGIFQQERSRRDWTEYTLRTKLTEASQTIGDLINQVNRLEAARSRTMAFHPEFKP